MRPHRYRVLLTRGAEQDIQSICDYIAEHDEPANAERVLDRLLATTTQLSVMPERGSYPREMLELGIRDFRQVFFKPYRLIYRVIGSEVMVFVIADGRRNLQSLLTQRLLGA